MSIDYETLSQTQGALGRVPEQVLAAMLAPRASQVQAQGQALAAQDTMDQRRGARQDQALSMLMGLSTRKQDIAMRNDAEERQFQRQLAIMEKQFEQQVAMFNMQLAAKGRRGGSGGRRKAAPTQRAPSTPEGQAQMGYTINRRARGDVAVIEADRQAALKEHPNSQTEVNAIYDRAVLSANSSTGDALTHDTPRGRGHREIPTARPLPNYSFARHIGL